MTKMTSRLAIVVFLALLLLFAGLPSALADGGDGVISGKVQNGTSGGGSVAGTQVVLHTIEHQSEGASQTASADKDGNYRFENLNTAGTYAYSVEVKYQSISYGSNLLVFENGETAKTADVNVFETTDKPDGIVIDRAHVIMDVNQDQALSVMEILVVTNSGDRSFVASNPAKGTLHVGIPKDAKNLQLEPNLADVAMAVADGFNYVGPVEPGSSQFMYAYELPYSSGGYDLVRSFDYPILQLSFLMPDKGIKATSSQLKSQDPLQLSDNGPKYLHLLGDNIPAAGPVTVHVDGLPVPSPLSALRGIPPWAIAAAGLVVLGAGVAFLVVRRRRSPGRDGAYLADNEPVDEPVDEDDLVDEYAEDDPEPAEPRPARK